MINQGDENIFLSENERLDDLQCKGYKLIQNTDIFCFGMDAVLLSSYAKVGKKDAVLDMGCGNGIIPVLLAGKTESDNITGLEIQDISAALAKRNVEINGLSDRVNIVKGDIKEASKIFGGASFNVITTNPPYMNTGIVNPESEKAIARHEVLCTLEDVILQASKMLKMKGRFYMIHRPQRLVDIMYLLRKYKIEPKEMILVQPKKNSEPNLVLIEAVKGGNPQLTVKHPLIVYEENGEYTQDLLKYYGE